MSALQKLIDYGVSNELTRMKEAQTELAALREIARLARLVRREYPGLLAVMWEDDHKRQLPPMREKFDAAFAALDGDAK